MNAKLTKGLAAAAISAAMMLGAAAPALAAETATPLEGKTVNVPVNYTEKGNGDAPSETVSYSTGTSQFSGNNYYNTTTKPIPTVTITGATVDPDGVNGTGSAITGNLVVTVPDDYKAVGEYTYNFTRDSINDAGVTDNVPTGLTVVVTVTNHIENGSVVEGKFDRYVVIKDASNNKYDNEKGVNLSYAAGQLTVTKKVTGNLGDQNADNKFPFKIQLYGLNGKTVRGTYTYSVAGKASDQKITFNEKGETTVEASIAHNESIVVKDLPAGVKYTVSELDGDTALKLDDTASNGYKLANIDTSASGYGTIVGEDEDQAIYTNEKNGDVKTGVLLNNAPYIAIIGGAAVVAIYVVNKRRHSDMD
jgi:hypothetical protein